MLILKRKFGEKIIINNGEIVITALGMRDGSMRIGIDADKSIVIDREEVDRAKRRERNTLE